MSVVEYISRIGYLKRGKSFFTFAFYISGEKNTVTYYYHGKNGLISRWSYNLPNWIDWINLFQQEGFVLEKDEWQEISIENGIRKIKELKDE